MLAAALLLAGSGCAGAEDLTASFGGMSTIIYAIAAGIAALMIAVHAIKYKASAGAGERNAARKSIVNVIIGLLLITVATFAVHLLFYPQNAGPQPLPRTYTFKYATTHTHPTTTSSTSSTVPGATSTTALGTTTSSGSSVTTSTNCAPKYEPANWNSGKALQCNNCYNYGCDKRTDNFAQPGYASGVGISMACSSVINGAKADGLAYLGVSESSCSGCTHKVALVVASGTDFHWYRLDDNNYWSHKPGSNPVTDKDASGNKITTVESANRNYGSLNYAQVCGYFCVDKTRINIAGSRAC